MLEKEIKLGDRLLSKTINRSGKVVSITKCIISSPEGESESKRYMIQFGDRLLNEREEDVVKMKDQVYLASGWFSTEQERTRLACLGVLKEFEDDLHIFSPKDEVICPPDAEGDKADAIYKGNVNAIHISTFIVCNTCEKDMGTIHESGVASEAGIPIIYYAELPKGAKFNLMLARSGVAVATNPDELREIIQFYKDNNWDFNIKKTYAGLIE